MEDTMSNIEKTQELTKLYQLLEKVSQAMLGSDHQTRSLFRQIKKEVILRIKNIESELRQTQKEW